MVGFIDRYNILSSCQYGFRKGLGTTHAIIKFLSYIVPAYHEKIYCACFFLDLKKAFDTIDHKILLQKLNHYGFRGQCYEYLRSYFHNRKQYVKLNEYESDMMTVQSGVPQGSILGPLCFSLFINDLPLAVDALSVMFADDAAFVVTACSLPELYCKIQKLFDDIAKYLSNNRLIANSSKSKLMMFSSRPTQNLPELVFCREVIEWIDEFKYLGLTITNKLSFSRHINRISMNISRITGLFTNLRSLVPVEIMMKIFYALAYPHLINHVIVWGSAPACHLRTLSVRLNNMLRVILGVRWVNGLPATSTNDMYKENKLLKLESIFKYYLFKFLRQLLDGGLPDFYNCLLQPYLPTHTYGTRNGRFRHPALVCEVERRYLSHQLITLHDNLPEEMLNQILTRALRSFKTSLLNLQ